MDDFTVQRGDKIQSYLETTAYRSTGLGLTRETRATVDQVLDPKTVEVLQKMKKQGVFDELAGCISTGKEANVYFGMLTAGGAVAVKVYKTSILGFRDRDEYVDGEFRFRHGYCKSNPRKMVALWAEKEQRNLTRLTQAGIKCPSVIQCKRNVLVMSLIGEPGRAAPRLKDATELPAGGWFQVYRDVILATRRMFQECKLVHGDLSEYNMLLTRQGELVIIDVSQSVGVDHPRSLEFLKRDCLNINLFFLKKLEGIVPLQDLFKFIIDRSFEKSSIESSLLDELLTHLESESAEDDSVFLQTWVPSCLAEMGSMVEVERLIDEKKSGKSSVFDNLFATPTLDLDSQTDDSEEESGSDSDESSSDEDGEEKAEIVPGSDGHKPESMSKQEWKKLVKEEKREARKHKVPKHLKQKRNLKKYGSK